MVSWLIEINFFLNGFKSYKIGVYTNDLSHANSFFHLQSYLQSEIFRILLSDPWCWPEGSQRLGTRLSKEHLRVLKNLLKHVRAFQIELETGSVGFFKRKENWSTWRKTSRSKGENQQKQIIPTYGADAGVRSRTTLVEGECSHHCATLATLRP